MFDDVPPDSTHAEAIACPACGPQIALFDSAGRTMATGKDGVTRACALACVHCRADAIAQEAGR